MTNDEIQQRVNFAISNIEVNPSKAIAYLCNAVDGLLGKVERLEGHTHTPPAPAKEEDWTEVDGKTSPKYEEIVRDVRSIMDSSALSSLWIETTARLIVSKLVHVHHLAPKE